MVLTTQQANALRSHKYSGQDRFEAFKPLRAN